MHEFGVAAGVLDLVEARAAGRPVRAVRLHVGALHRLDRDVFDTAFALMAEGGVADGAEIEVVEVAVTVRCACGATTTADELVVACGRCHAHDLELLAGDDLVLESITVTDTPTAQEVG
ncbi:hydrogenase maturation nickel metallochaperone HypA [Actinomycetospora sp. TBRC 11914]|uniref:hydrogenase maturation nickel metallochaperone HypA/HybF n=1 Tax=Actinomycetospora sp. TBRC 11914 TaxID=2729387 RepID=UPI00145DD2A6|nr:hydrogenase maturation nickel metallochaperone HypA [Actinomycetospora sp. TBRC 11914]NMO91321.1 hydrogenase maturation nickel metallochaperone HypA [Actinomycetospora sp. TBRC 11914]